MPVPICVTASSAYVTWSATSDESACRGLLVGVVVHVPRLIEPVEAATVGDDELGRAVVARIERDAVLERGRQRERLERTARLPVALRSEVELQPLTTRDVDGHRAHLAVPR